MKIIVMLLVVGAICALVWWGLAPGGVGEAPLEPLAPAPLGDAVDAAAAPLTLSAPADDADSFFEDSFGLEPASARKSVDTDDLFGRVVDLNSGAPVEGCVVYLLAAGRSVDRVRTDEAGEFSFERGRFGDDAFELRASAPEGWVLVEPERSVAAPGAEPRVQVELRAKRWPPDVAGDISGWLRAESGGFAPGRLPRRDHLVLDLVSTGHPPIARRGEIARTRNEKGLTEFRFVIRDVPAGEYRLTLSSLGNYRWLPESVLVQPPASDIEFLCYDLDEVLELAFEVFDAESGERVRSFETRHIKQTNTERHGVLLHTGPLEGEQFPLDVAFDWSLRAYGYATAYGDETHFALEEGRRVARVQLERGWSTRLLVMGGEPTPRPLLGAEVYLDGELAGTTDADGTLNLKAATTPEGIEVRYGDWQPSEPIDPTPASGTRLRSGVTPVVMEAPEVP